MHPSDEFEWDIFLLAGDPARSGSAQCGNIKGDAFGSPDGLWIDVRDDDRDPEGGWG